MERGSNIGVAMKHAYCFAILIIATQITLGQVTDAPDAAIKDIPVNYTEAKVGTYALPEVLKLADGQPVSDAETWLTKRRPEIVKLFEENQFGRAPAGRPMAMSFDVFDKGTPAFDGKAIRRQVT